MVDSHMQFRDTRQFEFKAASEPLEQGQLFLTIRRNIPSAPSSGEVTLALEPYLE
jgi:hypothetical protein